MDRAAKQALVTTMHQVFQDTGLVVVAHNNGMVAAQSSEFRKKVNYIYQREPYVSGSWSLDHGGNRSLHLNARFSPSRFRLRQVNHVIPTSDVERDDTLHENYKTDIFEVGGDITRPLAGGALKLVALVNNRNRSTFDDYLFRGLGGAPILGGYEQVTKSKLGESLAKLNWTKADVLGFSVEAGGELAFNKLDYALNYVALEAGGGKTPITLPLENATVSEIRGEFYVNAGRQFIQGTARRRRPQLRIVTAQGAR